MHRIMRLLCAQLAVAATAATTKRSAARRVRYRGGETAQKKTLDDFLRHLGDGELATVWEKTPKLWRRVDGCGPELFSFDDAVKGAEAGLLDNAAVADAVQAEAGRWVAEKAGASSADDLRRALAKGTVFFNGAGLAFPALAASAPRATASSDYRRTSTCTSRIHGAGGLRVAALGRAERAGLPVLWYEAVEGVAAAAARAEQGPVRARQGRRPRRGSGRAVLDVTLEPGDVLYVPLGWVHATSTADSAERSCHATLGVDTYFYGLCWSNARSIALARNSVGDDVDPGALDEATFSRLYGAVPVGFLRPQALDDEAWLDRVGAWALQDDLKRRVAARRTTRPCESSRRST